MNDRVVGLFDELATAERARSELIAAGVERERLTVKRVLQPGHRGFSDADVVHSLIHAPPIGEEGTISKDAGTVILIVEMVEPPEADDADASVTSENAQSSQDTGGLDSHDTAVVMGALGRLGATETQVVEATPPLDL